MAEAKTLPSGWWADNDGKAMWLRRHDANNQDELFWCDDAGADYLNDLEAQVALLAEARAALDALLKSYEAAQADQYDFPGSPWTPERGVWRDGSQPDEEALAARDLLARITPSLTP